MAKILSISAQETYGLRELVLRPGQPPEASRYSTDARSVHFGAFVQGEIRAIVSAHPDTLAPVLNNVLSKDSWRIRGMATHPEFRGQFLGSACLNGLEVWARERGIPALWCNARIGALSFYKKAGYEIFGEKFEIPLIGEHYVMAKAI